MTIKEQNVIIMQEYGKLSTSQIAKKLGVSHLTVQRRLARLIEAKKAKERIPGFLNIISDKFKKAGYNSLFEARESMGHENWMYLIHQTKSQIKS